MSTEEKKEEEFKTLTNIGVILSILIMIGVFVTIGVTDWSDEPSYEDRMAQQARRDSIAAADLYAYDYDSYYDDPGDYYAGGPGTIESENDSLRDLIENSYYITTYRQDLIDYLEDETDNCAKLIKELYVDLGDTMSLPGVSGTAVSIDFFDRTGRDEALFSALFEYRETVEEMADDAGLYDVTSYRDYFPLRESSSYGYIKSWDEDEFQQDPVDVMNYLKNMEMDLRYYENQVLWDCWY